MLNYFKDQTIFISGGTGSLGAALTENILLHNPKKIIIYSRSEEKQYNMKKKFHSDKLRFFIGDVRDINRLMRATYETDIIIHTAAMKHIDICENDPIEAIKTNINGTENIINSAIDNNVQKVINISTDKAVNPSSLYGATKMTAEKLITDANVYSNHTKFCSVRGGNLINSSGSVIPYWKSLIDEGYKTLPLTDERMERFFLTKYAFFQLVDYAIANMTKGEIFISDQYCVKMIDIIKALKMKPEIIGMRPNEKLSEEFIANHEIYNLENGYIRVIPQFDWYEKIKANNKTYEKLYADEYHIKQMLRD